MYTLFAMGMMRASDLCKITLNHFGDLNNIYGLHPLLIHLLCKKDFFSLFFVTAFLPRKMH